jgi:hypothetical protein
MISLMTAGWKAWILWLAGLALIGACSYELIHIVLTGSRTRAAWGLGGFAAGGIATVAGFPWVAARWRRSHPGPVERWGFTPRGIAQSQQVTRRRRSARSGGATFATAALAVAAANAPEPERSAVLGVCAGFFLLLLPTSWWIGHRWQRLGLIAENVDP